MGLTCPRVTCLESFSLFLSQDELFAFYSALIYVHHPQEEHAHDAAKTALYEHQVDNVDGKAHSPNRKANGMLSLFPAAEMIALETNGPIKADVFPI